MKLRPRRLIIFGTLLGLLAIAALVAAPLFLNPEYVKRVALNQFQQAFGPHISIGDTRFSLFPYPSIEVFEVIVKEHPDAHAFFRAQRARLDLRLTSLVQRSISIRELALIRPEVELRRDRHGAWRTLRSTKPGARPGSAKMALASLLLMEHIEILGGRLTIIDESPLEAARGIVVEHLSASVETSAKGAETQTAALTLAGRLRQTSGHAQVKLHGILHVHGIEQPASTGAYPPPDVEFEGHMGLKGWDAAQTEGFLPVPPATAEIAGLLDIDADLRIVPADIGHEAVFSQLLVQSDVGRFSGNASVTGLFANDMTLSITVDSSPISLELVHAMVPRDLVPSPARSLLETARLNGMVQLLEGTVSSSTRPELGVSVVGTIALHNIGLHAEEHGLQLEDVHGSVIIEPDRIRVTDVSGSYNGVPLQTAEGLVLHKDDGLWAELDVQGHVPAAHVARLILGGDADTESAEAPSWRVTQGEGDLWMKFAGYLTASPNVSLIEGEYVAQGLTVQLPQLPHPIVEGRGRVVFSPTDIKLDDVRGKMGENLFRLDGTLRTQGRIRYERLRVHAILEGGRFPWISQASTFDDAFALQGSVVLDATLSGLAAYPLIQGQLNLADARIRIPAVLEKHASVPGLVEFEVQVKPRNIIALKRAELVVLPLRLSMRGNIRLQPEFEIHAKLNTGPIYLGLLPEGVRVADALFSAGILEVSLDIRGMGRDIVTWEPRGWVALTEGAATVDGLEAPLHKVLLRTKIDPARIDVTRAEFHLGDSDAQVTGHIKTWRTQPMADITVASTQFDLDLLIPSDDASPLREFVERLAANGTLLGSAAIQRATYHELQIDAMRANIKIRDGLVTVDQIRGHTYDEPLAGRVFIHVPLEKPAAVRGSFHIKGVPFERLQQTVGQEERLVTGTLSVRGMLQGHGRDRRGVLPTINGHMDVVIERGHVHRGTVVPKILSILNLPSLLQGEVDLRKDGFPFDTVTTSLTIAHGQVRTDNMIVDSPIVKMTMAGGYHFVNDQMDVVAAVSPFGSYSRLLDRIPLFGRIFAGDRPGLTTALFGVTGSLSAPNIEYLPAKSFATGLTGLAQLAFDILKNTVTLPIDLLSNDEPNTNTPSLSPSTSESP